MVPENDIRVPKYYLLYIIVLFVGKIWREMLTTDPGESPELHQASRQTISWDYRTFLHTRPAMFDRNIWTATVEKWRLLEDSTWFCDYTLGWCWHLNTVYSKQLGQWYHIYYQKLFCKQFLWLFSKEWWAWAYSSPAKKLLYLQITKGRRLFIIIESSLENAVRTLLVSIDCTTIHNRIC